MTPLTDPVGHPGTPDGLFDAQTPAQPPQKPLNGKRPSRSRLAEQDPDAFTAAGDAARAWHENLTARGLPVVAFGGGSPFVALRDRLLWPALHSGYTRSEVWQALVDCGVGLPTVGQWERALQGTRGQHSNGRPRPATGFYDPTRLEENAVPDGAW